VALAIQNVYHQKAIFATWLKHQRPPYSCFLVKHLELARII